MKKIKLFSIRKQKAIEGIDAELYCNFYLILNNNYIFTFCIDSPNLACSDRHPIKLIKQWIMLIEEENVKYMRRYEKSISRKEMELQSVTPTVIEDIKAEIQKALDEDRATDTENAKVQAIALMWCLEIIDKHIGSKNNVK